MSSRAPYDPSFFESYQDFGSNTTIAKPQESEQTIAEVWRQETSRKFHALMDSAMMVSFYKYGAVADGYPERVNALDSLEKRLDMYLRGKPNPDFGEPGEPEFLTPPGNVEFLVDVANFAMIEFMHPAHPGAHYRATDANESPGRVAANTEIWTRPTQVDNLALPTANEKAFGGTT